MEKINSHLLEAKRVVLGHQAKNPITQKPFDFAIPTNKTTALLGLNGSGKSTLINALIGQGGLISGSITSNGRDVRKLSPQDLARLISIVPQEPVFPIFMNVTDFLRLAFLPQVGIFGDLPSIDSESLKPILVELDIFRLLQKNLLQLSSGERQKVSLARAILQSPKILLLDEPTNHLDIRSSAAFWRTLLKIKAVNSVDILLSTHDLGFVEKECDWVLLLECGNLIFSGTKKDFFEQKWDHYLLSPER